MHILFAFILLVLPTFTSAYILELNADDGRTYYEYTGPCSTYNVSAFRLINFTATTTGIVETVSFNYTNSYTSSFDAYAYIGTTSASYVTSYTDCEASNTRHWTDPLIASGLATNTITLAAGTNITSFPGFAVNGSNPEYNLSTIAGQNYSIWIGLSNGLNTQNYIRINNYDSTTTSTFTFSTTTLDTIPASFIYSLFNGTNGAVTPIRGFTFTDYPTSTNTFDLETNAALIKGGSMTVVGGILPTTTDSYGEVAVDDLNAAVLTGDLNSFGTSSLYQQSYALFLSTTSTSSVLAYAQRAFPFNLILGLGYAVASFATNTVNTYNNTSHAVTVTMPGDNEIVFLNFASTTALTTVFN